MQDQYRMLMCLECSEMFSRLFTLERHMQTRHSVNASILHACEGCDKTFKRKDHLHRHEKIHTGEDLENCEQCGRGFGRKYLQQHRVSCRKRSRLDQDLLLGSRHPASNLTWNTPERPPYEERESSSPHSGRSGAPHRKRIRFVQHTRRDHSQQQRQRVAMPVRSTPMQSGPEPQTPKPIGQNTRITSTPGAVETNRLENVSVEINWARKLDYSDYLSGESCSHCKTASELFSLIEAQMPDELQSIHGNRVKEVRVKALTPLQGESNTPRIKRDEVSGCMALRKLIKKLQSQPADSEIELEFLVVWE